MSNISTRLTHAGLAVWVLAICVVIDVDIFSPNMLNPTTWLARPPTFDDEDARTETVGPVGAAVQPVRGQARGRVSSSRAQA